jgi:hypothetical protein
LQPCNLEGKTPMVFLQLNRNSVSSRNNKEKDAPVILQI